MTPPIEPAFAALYFALGLPAGALILVASYSIRDRLRRRRIGRSLRGSIIFR